MMLENELVYDAYQNVVGAYSYRNRIIAEGLGKELPTKVIDLGCGTGKIAELIPDSVRYLGFDQSEVYLAEAQKRRPETNSRLLIFLLVSTGRTLHLTTIH
jgi:ubiquinone/menaquinone biosynthesis C-methylase UbiE